MRTKLTVLLMGFLLAAQSVQSQQPKIDSATIARANKPILRQGELIGVLTLTGVGATLGGAIRELNGRMDEAGRLLLGSIEKVWGFSNEVTAVRHSGIPGDELSVPEAGFVVGMAEPALRLLLNFDLGTG